MPVIEPPAARTIRPSSTLTSPAWEKSVFFQPSSLLPSKRTRLAVGPPACCFGAWAWPAAIADASMAAQAAATGNAHRAVRYDSGPVR